MQTDDEPSLVLKLEIEENYNKLKELLTCTQSGDKDIENLLSTLQMEVCKISDKNT